MLNYLNVALHSTVKQRYFGSLYLLGDRVLIDISTDMSANTRSTLDQDVGGESVEYRPSIN